MKSQLDKVESKVDKLDERLDSVDKHLAVYNKQLEIHIAGVNDNRKSIKEITELFSKKISHIDAHVTKAELLFKIFSTISMVALGAYLKQKFDIDLSFLSI